MEFFKYPDEPFCWVEMIPRDTISVIIRESVVIVVIPFSESEECKEEIINSCELFCIGFWPPCMSERIDKKHRVMKEKHPPKKTKIETWYPSCYWSDEGHYNDIKHGTYAVIIFMLDTDPFVGPKIWYFCWIHSWSLQKKPPHMSKEKTPLDTIGIFHGIRLCMMNSVVIWPCSSWASKTKTTNNEVYIFDNWMCLVCFVREISMVARCDTHCSNSIYQTPGRKCHPIPREIRKVERSTQQEPSMYKKNKKYTSPFKTRDIFHVQIIPLPSLLQNKNTWLWQ